MLGVLWQVIKKPVGSKSLWGLAPPLRFVAHQTGYADLARPLPAGVESLDDLTRKPAYRLTLSDTRDCGYDCNHRRPDLDLGTSVGQHEDANPNATQ